MTRSIPGRLHGLHLVLQELFEQQTDELVKLDGYRVDPGLTGLTPRALDELTATARQSLAETAEALHCLLYTSPSPRDRQKSRMPSSA